MKKLFLGFGILFLSIGTHAQKYVSKNATASFYSEAPLENITAESKKVQSIFNVDTREIAFSIPISSFQFEKKLMQEHFNEKYMETEKYPKATFTGTVDGFKKTKEGLQSVVANGNLTIHGVTRAVSIPGSLTRSNDTIELQAKFFIALADYKIKIPQLLWQNIAEQVEVTINATY